MTCGGEPGARLADRLGMSISGDGLLRILRRTTLEKSQTPQVLGVDDFAFRKGHTYGTILCDLERREPIDLLPERSKESFRDWLSRNPGIRIISRDRGMYYSQGGAEGAPQALHVADRWHLLSNLRDALARCLGRCSTEWQDLIHPKSRDERKTESKEEPSRSEQLSLSRRERRQQRFYESRELHRQGFDYRQIGRLLGIHAVTVSKFVEADHFPDRVVPSRTRLTDAYLEYLKQRWEQGCHNARVLYDELGKQGFPGSYDAVCRSVAPWRIGPRMRRANVAADRARTVPRLSADQLAWLLIQPPKARTTEGEQLVRQLSQQSKHWSVGIGLARLFPKAMREQNGEQFDGWLQRALHKNAPREIRRFAQGLCRDLDAVRMAFTSPWSNGQTEGHVNRLKMIKRQMYGRASFDLLRLRFLHAA